MLRKHNYSLLSTGIFRPYKMNSLGPWCQSQRSERSKEVGGISLLPQAIAGEGDLVLMTMVRCHVGEQ